MNQLKTAVELPVIELCGNEPDDVWTAKFINGNGREGTKVLVAIPSTCLTEARRLAKLLFTRSGFKGGANILTIVLIDDINRDGFIASANRAFKLFNTEFFVYCAQDAFPGRNWLKSALHTIESSGKSLLAFNDGKWFGLLASFGLVRRNWALHNYESNNLFYEGYKTHYADTELTLLAIAEGKHIYDANALLVEVDWGKDSKPANLADKLLFNQRKTNKFDNRVTNQKLLGLFS